MREWNNTVVCGAASAAAIVLIYVTLARRMQLWGKAVLFGALSAAVIVLIYATPPYRDSHFAGANFGYNFSFFFPALLSSFLFWVVGLAFYIAFVRSRAGRSPSKIILPPALLLPFAVQVAWMIFLLVMWSHPSNQALERTAARRAFTFQMMEKVLVEAMFALGGGRSACSR